MQTRQVTVPLCTEIASGYLVARDLPPKQADSLPGQLGSAQGSREGQRGCRARGACTSLACHCVSAVCRSQGSHGEQRVHHHDAHRDLPPHCPAATADTEVGHGAGKASTVLVTPRAFPDGAKEQHQPVSCLHLKQKGLAKQFSKCPSLSTDLEGDVTVHRLLVGCFPVL